jgi:uncharacterized membrane protein/ribosomal protein L40E
LIWEISAQEVVELPKGGEMLCPKCAAENAEGHKYCQKCGSSLAAETPKSAGGKVFCPKCGAENTGDDKSCPKCGSSFAAEAPKATGSTTSLEPNVAGLLCYLFGWITGLIFILIEKENKFVRFHAIQSIVTFGAFSVLWIPFYIFNMLDILAILFGILQAIIGVLVFVLWIVLMIKAYQGERFKLPIAGDIAEKNS